MACAVAPCLAEASRKARGFAFGCQVFSFAVDTDRLRSQPYVMQH